MLTCGAIRRGGPRTLEVRAKAIHYEDRAANASYAAGSDRFWARVNGKWCRVLVHQEESSSSGSDLMRRFMITVEVLFASMADLDELMSMAKVRANVIEGRQPVDVCNKYGSSTTLSLPRRNADTLCLPDGLYSSIVDRLREFSESRDEYERTGIPWRIGLLLHGEPGTGKTSIAHALASTLNRRLAVVPLADVQCDEDLVSAFEAVRDDSIVLIEDVDCVFKDRKGHEAAGVTFSGFLNCIDGMLAPHNGRILIMSTNHVEQLDPALIRPGRIDLRIEVPLLTRAAAMSYVDRVFGHLAFRHDVVDSVLGAPAPTAAELINALMAGDWQESSSGSLANPGFGTAASVGRRASSVPAKPARSAN